MEYTGGMENFKNALECLTLGELEYLKSRADLRGISDDLTTFCINEEQWRIVVADAIKEEKEFWGIKS